MEIVGLILVALLVLWFIAHCLDKGLIEFILDIIAGIVDAILYVLALPGDIINSIRGKKKAHRKKVLKIKHKNTVDSLKNFTTYEELPDERDVVRDLYHSQGNLNDHQKFLCARKLVDMGISSYKNNLAEMYYYGQGTEKDIEKARILQKEYFECTLRKTTYKLIVSSWQEWWTQKNYFVDIPAMRAVAETVYKRGEPGAYFLLEDVISAEAYQIPLGANKELQKEIFEKHPDDPYAQYHIWFLRKDKTNPFPLKKAACGGCFPAYSSLRDMNMLFDIEKIHGKFPESDINEFNGLSLEEAVNKIKIKAQNRLNARTLYDKAVSEYSSASRENALKTLTTLSDPKDRFIPAYQFLLEHEANQGNKTSAEKLGIIYEQGIYGEQNNQKALQWYKVASDLNNAEAQYHLANVYEHGELGVESDWYIASEYYKKAAVQNHLPSILTLGCYYAENDEREMAEKLLLRVAKSGKNREKAEMRKKAYYELVKMYQGGEMHTQPFVGVEKAYQYALAFAKLDLPEERLKEIRKLNNGDLPFWAFSICYKPGRKSTRGGPDVEEDDKFCEPLYDVFQMNKILNYEKAAKAGDFHAMRELYFCYDECGEYHKRKLNDITIYDFKGDRDRAEYWLEKAISLGDFQAMETKALDHRKFGLSKEDGQQLLREVARKGSDSAKLQLEVDAMEAKQKQEAERLKAEYNRQKSQEYVGSTGYTDSEVFQSAGFGIPDTITGPYGHQYHVISRSSDSATFIGDNGETVTIHSSDMGALDNATTSNGYFHW